MQLLSAGSGASAGTLPRACGKLPERCAHRRTTQINSNTQYGTLSVAIEGRLMPLAGAARKCAAVRTEHCGKTEGFHTVEDTYRNSITLNPFPYLPPSEGGSVLYASGEPFNAPADRSRATPVELWVRTT